MTSPPQWHHCQTAILFVTSTSPRSKPTVFLLLPLHHLDLSATTFPKLHRTAPHHLSYLSSLQYLLALQSSTSTLQSHSFHQTAMPPAPNSALPLQERLLALAKTLQCTWSLPLASRDDGLPRLGFLMLAILSCLLNNLHCKEINFTDIFA